MKKWFDEVILETDNIKLIPLEISHKDALIAASNDGDLSKIWFTNVPSSIDIDKYIAKALEDFKQDKGLAFVVIDKRNGQIIGTTRYANSTPEHRRLEIGYTWYAQTYQKTYVNSECKMLLLTHAFEELNAIAVEFRTHWYNFQSRSAIARLGAKQDGVLRNHQVLPDGSFRDTIVFSITENEWKPCKISLTNKIEQIHIRQRQ